MGLALGRCHLQKTVGEASDRHPWKPCGHSCGSPSSCLLFLCLQMVPGCVGARTSLGPGSSKLTAVFLPDPQRFTQSMKLDGELGRLMLEHGTMLGPPTEAERAEERARKELARKVCSPRLCPAGPLLPSILSSL